MLELLLHPPTSLHPKITKTHISGFYTGMYLISDVFNVQKHFRQKYSSKTNYHCVILMIAHEKFLTKNLGLRG